MHYALFMTVGWAGTAGYISRGNTASELLSEFEKIQPLDSLLFSCHMETGKRKKQAIDSFVSLVQKHRNGNLTMDDLTSLNLSLSVGGVACISVAEGSDGLTRLEKIIPDLEISRIGF